MISCMIRKWRSPLQAVTLLQRLWELPQQNNLLQKDMLLVIDDLLLSSIADIALGGFVTHLVTWILTSYMHPRFLLLFLVFLCLLLLLFQYGYSPLTCIFVFFFLVFFCSLCIYVSLFSSFSFSFIDVIIARISKSSGLSELARIGHHSEVVSGQCLCSASTCYSSWTNVSPSHSCVIGTSSSV